MSVMRDELLRFVNELRTASLRISVAESLDAMRAVARVGFERAPMREALAATLVKDEADRARFDAVFTSFFGAGAAARSAGRRHGANRRLAGTGGGHGTPAGTGGVRDPRTPPVPATERLANVAREPSSPSAETEGPASSGPSVSAERDAAQAAARVASGDADMPGDHPEGGDAAGRIASLRTAQTVPFAAYTQLEYEMARDALAPLARRFRIRVARRLKRGNRGRIDFRGTIRAAMQRGGAMVDLRWRMPRPAYINLLLLADVSGSVRYASELMLEIAAGARASFRSVRSFLFVDHIAEVDFEDGRVVMGAPLDLYARSDFGRVFAEVRERRVELLGPATLVIIMGDGRNNRRPARADHLREIVRSSQAVVWLNPEPRARWGSGDSAILQYEREVKALLECENLSGLELALERSVSLAL